MQPDNSFRRFLTARLSSARALRGLFICSLIGFASFVRPFYRYYRPTGGGYDIQGGFIGHDFVNVWLGAKLTLAGKVSEIFVRPTYVAELHAQLGANYLPHTFSYPPHILLLQFAFGLLPYFPELALWTAAGLAACLFTLRRAGAGRTALAAFALSPVAILNCIIGHNGFFTATFFLGGLYFSEASPVLAGVLVGLLTVKPHLGILLPLVLLLRRNWTCLASASVTVAAMIGLSVALWGLGPWRQFFTDTLPFQTSLLNTAPQGVYYLMLPGIYGNMLMMGTITPASKALWMTLHVLSALWATYISLKAVKGEGLTPRSILMLTLAAIVVTPYAWAFDMMAVMGALALYLGAVETIALPAYLLFGLLWTLPMSMYEMKLAQLPLPSMILLAALLCLDMASGPAAARKSPA